MSALRGGLSVSCQCGTRTRNADFPPRVRVALRREPLTPLIPRTLAERGASGQTGPRGRRALGGPSLPAGPCGKFTGTNELKLLPSDEDLAVPWVDGDIFYKRAFLEWLFYAVSVFLASGLREKDPPNPVCYLNSALACLPISPAHGPLAGAV